MRAWAPAVVWAAFIFVLSSLPDLPSPPGGLTDKHGHVGMYGVLSALVLRGLSGVAWPGVTIGTAVAAAGIATTYGATDEIHQRFVPGRESSWADLAADAVGAGIGAGGLWAWAIIRRRA
jgi:VanZ family protein